MPNRRLALPLLLTLIPHPGDTMIFRVPIGNFSEQGLSGWEEHSFKGNTRYQLVHQEGMQVLYARSQASASGLYKTIEVNLRKTPILHWRWRVDTIIESNDEQTREGDDYPARIYVVKKGLFPWNTKAINYVWSSHQNPGDHWPNPYTDNARMIALRSGATETQRWVSEQRDVRADFKQLFGEAVDDITQIAIMTDSDNTGKTLSAYYGDIYFSAE